MPDSINTHFVNIKSTGFQKNITQASALGSHVGFKSLSQGQLLEAVIIKVTDQHIFLDAKGLILQANSPGAGAQIGERYLLKVVDAHSLPPKLKLISDAQLPSSSLAGVSTFLRSLLFRHDPLMPMRHALSTLHNLQQSQSSEVVASVVKQFEKWKTLPSKVDANWVKEKLKMSGLFSEAIGKLQGELDLKGLFSKVNNLDKSVYSGAVDGVTSAQIKALDALLEGGIRYHFLMPFVDNGVVDAEVFHSSEDQQEDKWRIYLRHESHEFGLYLVDILLQKNDVSVVFKTDKKWLLEAINSSAEKLKTAINKNDINVIMLKAMEICEASKNPYGESDAQSILDMRV